MKLPLHFINKSVRLKFLLPLGSIILCVTIAVVLILIRDANARLELIAKRRGELLIHSIHTTSYILRNPDVFQRYIRSLGQHPGISSITVYSKITDKIIASTEPDLRGKSLKEISSNKLLVSEILQVNKERSLYLMDRSTTDNLIYLAGPMPRYAVRNVPRELLDATVLISFHRNYFETIVDTSTSRLIVLLLIEISALTAALILITNQVIIKPMKVVLRTLDAWKAGERTFTPVPSLDEIGIISKNLYETLKALDVSNQEVKDITKALNSHAIVSITDSMGKITYVNDRFCDISKYSREELLGQEHRIINSGYHTKEFMGELWETITNGHVWNHDIKNKAKDGSEYWVATTIVPFLDKMGKPTHYISIRTDITATKQAELILKENELKLEHAWKAAEAATYAKSQFLANMSHEIRTPLTSIIGFAEAAREEGVSVEERIISLDRILNSGKHLLGVINDILDLSKIDAGALKVEMQPFSPVAVVENVKTLMVPRIAEKSLNLTINYTWPLPATITNDSLRLMQILVNLVSNAIKFTDRGEVAISVLCDRDEQKLYFSVADTGIGITADQVGRLFLPFSQTDIGATRRFGGSGLGLFICKSLVTMLGGEISVTSQPDIGSTFSFSITTKDLSNVEWISSIPENRPPTAIDRSVISRMRGNVLIVDDAEDNRALIKFSLRNSRISLTMAENGQEAVEAALSRKFDLIIMDMQMPVMDGYEATRQMRKHGIKTPIVAFTAAILKNDLLKCTEAGCSTYLAKPFNQDTLVECLSKYLFLDTEETEEPKIEITRTQAQPNARSIHLRFINGLESRINNISDALGNRDFSALKNAAHKLAGTAGLFGYPTLARICTQLEKVSLEEDLTICDALLEQIGATYEVIMKEAEAIKCEETSFNDIGQRVQKNTLSTHH